MKDLIEKLEAAKLNPSSGMLAEGGNNAIYNQGIETAVAVVRQHRADNLGNLSPESLRLDKIAIDAPSEISDNSLTALEALTYLVSLKAHKDQFGKTPYYQQAQPRAWERAIKALGNESMREPEPVSVEACAKAAYPTWLHEDSDIDAMTKAVLDAAGVPYVD